MNLTDSVHQLKMKTQVIELINEDELTKLIYHNELTLERVKQWDMQGGDLMIKDCVDCSILHSGSRNGQLDIVQYLIDKGVEIDNLNVNQSTPLLSASIYGQFEIVDYLLDKGANINHQDDIGWSALHYVCYHKYFNLVKLLVERKINTKLVNEYNETAFRIAEHRGYHNQLIINYLKELDRD